MSKIETDLGCEIVEPSSPGAAAEVGVRWVPVPPEVIVVAVHWYLRFNLSYRDVEELLVERGVEVDHVTVYGTVQITADLLINDVLMLVCDGLKGLPDAVATVWPRTIVQTCVVHLLRNSFRYAARQD